MFRNLTKRVIAAAHHELSPLFTARNFINATGVLPMQAFTRTRTALLRASGVKIGKHSQVQGPIRMTGAGAPEDLSIGDYTLITGDLHVDLGAPVRIGHGVRIGHSVTLLTVSHEIGSAILRAGPTFCEPISVGDGAWLASRATVLPGVTIGEGAVVAAGAVVSRDVPPHTLVAGIPARVIRNLAPPASSASEHLQQVAP